MFSHWKSSRKATTDEQCTVDYERSQGSSSGTHQQMGTHDDTAAGALMAPSPSPWSARTPFHLWNDSPVYLSLLQHLNDEEWSEIHEIIHDLSCSSMTKSQFTGLCTNIVMWVSEAASRIVLPALALVLDALLTYSRPSSPKSRSEESPLQSTGLIPAKNIVTEGSIDDGHASTALLDQATPSGQMECSTISSETYDDLSISLEPLDQMSTSMSTQEISTDSRAARSSFSFPSHISSSFVKWFHKRATPAVSEVGTQTTPPFLREDIPGIATSSVSLNVEPHVDSAASAVDSVVVEGVQRLSESAPSTDNFTLGSDMPVSGVSVTATNIVDMIMNEIFQDPVKITDRASFHSKSASQNKFEKLLSTETMRRLSPHLVAKVYRFIMEDKRTLPVRAAAARRIKSESSLPRIQEGERLERAKEAFSELVYSFTERCLSQQLQECLRLQDRPRSEISPSEQSKPSTSIDMEMSKTKKVGFLSRFFSMHSKTKNKVSPSSDFEDDDSNIERSSESNLGALHRTVLTSRSGSPGVKPSKIPIGTSSQSTSGSSCMTFDSSKTTTSASRKFRYILRFHRIHVSSEHLNFKATVQRRYTKRSTKNRRGTFQSRALPAQADVSKERLRKGTSQSSFGSSWITIDAEDATIHRSRIFGFLHKFFHIHPKTELNFKATVQRRATKRTPIYRPGTLHRIALAHRSEVTKGRIKRSNSSQSASGSSWMTVDSEDSNISRSRIFRFLSHFFRSN